MKKTMIIGMVICFAIAITACGKGETDGSKDKEKTTVSTEKSVTKQKEEVTSELGDKDKNLENIDVTLKDEKLLKSLGEFKEPDNLYYVLENSYEGSAKVITKYYIHNGFIRIETQSPEGLQIMIYNPEQRATYSFTDKSKTGFVSYDKDGSKQEVIAKADEYIDYSTLVSAEVTTLNKEQVIHIVNKGDSIESETETETHAYLSVKYCMPLKAEGYIGKTKIYTMEVIEINKDFEMKDSLFQVPGTITFNKL